MITNFWNTGEKVTMYYIFHNGKLLQSCDEYPRQIVAQIADNLDNDDIFCDGKATLTILHDHEVTSLVISHPKKGHDR